MKWNTPCPANAAAALPQTFAVNLSAYQTVLALVSTDKNMANKQHDHCRPKPALT